MTTKTPQQYLDLSEQQKHMASKASIVSLMLCNSQDALLRAMQHGSGLGAPFENVRELLKDFNAKAIPIVEECLRQAEGFADTAGSYAKAAEQVAKTQDDKDTAWFAGSNVREAQASVMAIRGYLEILSR